MFKYSFHLEIIDYISFSITLTNLEYKEAFGNCYSTDVPRAIR